MDRHSSKLLAPSFRTVSVGKCYAQTATARFGNDAKGAIRDRERTALGMNPEGMEAPFNWPNIDGQDEGHAHDSIYRLVPSMQGYRNNLTALSQAYNLYFVAYQGHIFVYIPRSVPKQTIPRHPDVQLYAPPSKEAISIGGCIDPITPHTINHIITGYLGKEEILVACYDDGDVVAYYVKEIAATASRTRKTSLRGCPSRPPRLFFHENVGQTAWGLAIHRKSRLIAVSTNRYEVTVFAFALSACQKKSKEVREFCDCCKSNDSTKPSVPRRARNWRIVVALGSHASNIPNICFVDGEDGQAEKVCAIDIKGVMWMADIWQMFQPVTQVPPSRHLILQSEEFWPASSRGWGVMALPEESFVPVDTLDEMLGLPEQALNVFQPGSGCPQPMVNVAECLVAIPDNPCPPPTLGGRAGQFYRNILNMSHDESLQFLVGEAVAANDMVQGGQSDESDAESEASADISHVVGDEDEDEEEEDDDDDEDEEEEEVEEDEEEEENADVEEEDGEGDEIDQASEDEAEEAEEVIVAQGNPEVIAADQGGSATLFPTPPAGQQFQQALQDLDIALGQLAYAVQEFQEAISIPDTPNPASVQPQSSQDQDSPASNPEKRKSDAMVFRQRSHNHLSSPPVRLDMAFFPHSGKIQAVPRPTAKLLEFLRRPIEFNDNVGPPVEERLKKLTKRYHFIRTFEKDLELRSLRGPYETGQREIGVLCPDALTLGCFQERSIRPYFRATSRLSLLFHVPELSLVVVGSPIGRVILITPTKLKTRIAAKTGMWHHGLRVECVLPRLSDEQAHRQVLRPLHGLAVGPVQDNDGMGGDAAGRATAPKRYRLMMHYRNHDILTYEIMREEHTGRLCIF
ncbi:hypothetical protein HDV57DRAFT_286068 [Trichoderma longibrachiatum]|uniref:Uncharacterized protein n=1 Tax=Trichoderma longibrachiatum ATCC 18648 TaxID=983965 RepID=A0A2T4CDJ3_TRILO|nr:hypothetical protein M440DRAFT_1398878 [Trichoderma longibrachiatum ATCC 18648]